MNRIIAERDPGGLWTAWFDGQSDQIQVGRSQGEAVRRLLARTRHRRIPPTDIWADPSATRDGHLEYVVVTDQNTDPCPDCQGSGQYIGLSVVEPCQTCQGSGMLLS